jgi:uncharacterized protein (DUF1778 family)
MPTPTTSRFDIRLPQDQKELFERAAACGGFRSLTEFVVYASKEKANQIIDKHNSILSSERDKEVFFDAIMNPPEPSERLKNAAFSYKKVLANK